MLVTATMEVVNQGVPSLDSKSPSETWKQRPEDPENNANNRSYLSNDSEEKQTGGSNKVLDDFLDKDMTTPECTKEAQHGCKETVTTAEESLISESKEIFDCAPETLEIETADTDEVDEDGPPMDLDRITPLRTISGLSAVSIGTANSGCGASTDGSNVRSRAESIRARLREKEKILSEMVQRQAHVEVSADEKFKKEMNDVKCNLDKVEQEKYALEQKLEYLKNQQLHDQAILESQDVTDHDAFLRDKLNGIQRGFQEQASRIQALENEVCTKNAEIEEYRHEIVAKLKRIVDLEFDLEMHDIHYTDYANDQVKLGKNHINAERSVAESEDCAETDKSSCSSDSKGETIKRESSIDGEKTELTPKGAQEVIAKLLKDLDHLEAMHKKDKLKSTLAKDKLKNENEELRTQIRVLEQGQANSKNSSKGMKGDVSGYMNIYQLRKRVEILEAKRFLHRKEISRMQEQLDGFQEEAKVAAQNHEAEVARLNLELAAANTRCAQEQDDVESEKQHATMTQKITENYDMITKLQASSEIKDRQIATLKNEIQSLRLHEIAKGKTGNKYKQMDADVLKNDKETNERMKGEHDSDNDGDDEAPAMANVSASFVADIQRQLMVAHEQLVKKDQELVIERAKSACMAANLLDRIAELDKETERNKRRESMKHTGERQSGDRGNKSHDDNGEKGKKHHKTSDREGSMRSTRTADREGSFRGFRTSVRDDSTRSTRSIQIDDSGEKKKKRSSLIPFRFHLPGGKKDHGDGGSMIPESIG